MGSFSRITEVATRIAGQLPSEGQSATFKEFVRRFVNVMARALVALGRKPDYQEINRYASDVEPLLIDYFEYWLDREPAAGFKAVLAANRYSMPFGSFYELLLLFSTSEEEPERGESSLKGRIFTEQQISLSRQISDAEPR